MSQGFTVTATGLSAGSQDVNGLLGTCKKVGSDTVSTLGSMADAAAGHGALEAALLGAAEQGVKAFLDIGAAYQYTCESLAATAGTYTSTEQDITGKIGAIGAGAGGGG